jgi:hypothetical protein
MIDLKALTPEYEAAIKAQRKFIVMFRWGQDMRNPDPVVNDFGVNPQPRPFTWSKSP